MDTGQWMCSLCRTRFTRKSAWVRHAKRCSPSRRAASLRSRQKACTRCVRAKARCDLGQPVCSRCSLRNASCEYLGQILEYQPLQPGVMDKTVLSSTGVLLDAAAAAVVPTYYRDLEHDIDIDGDDGCAPFTHFPISETITMPYLRGDPEPELEAMDSHDLFGAVLPPRPPTPPPSNNTNPTHTSIQIDSDPANAIRDRWMNPLMVVNAPSARLAAHSMSFLFRVLQTYPLMLAFDEGFGCPVVHSRQLLQDTIRLPMANCVTLARMWDGHSQQSAAIVESAITQEMQRLVDEHGSYSEDDLLAAMQALLIYAIMLFSLPGRDDVRNGCFDLIKMIDLHQVAHKLAKTGVALGEEEASSAPGWDEWIRYTAKARTILAFFCFEWAYSAYNNLLSYHCHEIGPMLAPASKLLWVATSREEWEHRYSLWELRWRPRGFFRMRELMAVPTGVRMNERVNAWLAETDEFGMMIMTLVNAAE